MPGTDIAFARDRRRTRWWSAGSTGPLSRRSARSSPPRLRTSLGCVLRNRRFCAEKAQVGVFEVELERWLGV
eukprot:995359-Rhodomonas_salina.3